MWSKKKQVTVCPSVQQLEAFHLGRLPQSELAALAMHLEGCDGCEAILTDIARKQLGLPQCSDNVPSDQLLAEPEWKQLEAAAAAITPRPPTLPSILSAYQAPQIPGYKINRRVAMDVYEARPENSEDEVIARVFRGCVMRDESDARRLLTKSQETSSATQDCVLPAIDVVPTPAFTAVITPFVEAESLAQIIKARRTRDQVTAPPCTLTAAPDAAYLRAVTAILGQVIRATSVIHRRGDLFPELRTSSVLVASSLTTHLDDFAVLGFRWPNRGGLSAGLVPSTSRYPNELPDVLVTHPSFLAPEEWQMERVVGARADVFRLGVLAYHALTLHLPYGDGSVSRRTKPPRRPSDRQPLLSRGLDAIILRALAIKPDERFASAAEMHEAWLDDALAL